MTRTMEPGMRATTKCQISPLMGTGALRCKETIPIKDQDELAFFQCGRNNLTFVESIKPTGMDPAR